MVDSWLVAPSRPFRAGRLDAAKLLLETPRLVGAPGTVLNGLDRGRIEDYRVPSSQGLAPTGVAGDAQGLRASTPVPNPDRADGRWDPLAWLPDFVFDPREDAFPVDPAFDGNATLGDNAPERPGQGPGAYRDGLVGGKQDLRAAFLVTRKGEFHVLTTHFYFAHNKAGHYHRNDYATAQVYLKPGPDGRLAPAYLYTSWHHGGRLTPWSELALGPQGRPTVRVELGSHALSPLGPGDRAPEGLRVRGCDGQALLGGQALPGQALSFDALQGNVEGARLLRPGSPAHAARLKALPWGEAALNPFLPEDFAGRGLAWELRRWAKEGLQGAWRGLKAQASRILKGPKG